MTKRKTLGMSQAALAGLIGVTRQSVIAMEKGSSGLSIGTVLKALAVLGLTVEIKSPDDGSSTAAQDAFLETPTALLAPIDRTGPETPQPVAVAAPTVPDIDRIIEKARIGTRFPIFHQPLPHRARKRKAGDAA